jgi:oxygen-independent coproporphyrinogen-3 oxidase
MSAISNVMRFIVSNSSLRGIINRKAREEFYSKFRNTIQNGLIAEKNDLKKLMPIKDSTIYIHFPFCNSSCRDCTFKKTLKKEHIEQYSEALLKEIDSIGKLNSYDNINFNSVFFGGGTPSLFPIKYLNKIMERLNKYFIKNEKPQITLECSPESLDFDLLDEYRKIGINRITIGAQSFHNEVLQEMKRGHTTAQTMNVIEKVRRKEFEFSVDLIYGFDCQDLDMFLKDLKKAIDIGVSHLSIYSLARKLPENQDKKLEKKQREIYLKSIDFLKDNGFIQHSTDNFGRTEHFRNQYEEDQWKVPALDVLAFGSSAFGGIGDNLYVKHSMLQKYIECINNNIPPVTFFQMDNNEFINTKFFFGLHNININKKAFLKVYGAECFSTCKNFIDIMNILGYIKITEKEIKLTKAGLFFYTRLWSHLLFFEMLAPRKI